MLRLTFTPPGGETRTFEIPDLENSLDTREAELIEDNGGRQWSTFMEWAAALMAGSARAARVLLWVMLRRENPEIALDDLHFPMSALNAEEVPDTEPVVELESGKDEPGDSATSSP